MFDLFREFSNDFVVRIRITLMVMAAIFLCIGVYVLNTENSELIGIFLIVFNALLLILANFIIRKDDH